MTETAILMRKLSVALHNAASQNSDEDAALVLTVIDDAGYKIVPKDTYVIKEQKMK